MSEPSNGNSVGPSVLLNLQQMVDVLSHGTINRLGINFSDRYDELSRLFWTVKSVQFCSESYLIPVGKPATDAVVGG